MSDALRAVEKHLADLAADVVPRKELPSSFHWGLLQTMATALRSAEGMDQTARDLSRACAQNQETTAELRKEVERLNAARDECGAANVRLTEQLAEANKRAEKYREELQDTASDLDDGLNQYEQIGVKARINETLK